MPVNDDGWVPGPRRSWPQIDGSSEGCGEALSGVFDRAVRSQWNKLRALIDGHDAHDPEAIAEVRRIYAAAVSLPRPASSSQRAARRDALTQLSYLDRAGFACDRCAPMSACEIEDEAVEKTRSAGRGR